MSASGDCGLPGREAPRCKKSARAGVQDSGGESISLRVSILASGSSGNCTLLETSRTRLLVDAGLGKRETLRRLAALAHSVDRLDGIVISHEHTDHIGGLAALLGTWRTAVYRHRRDSCRNSALSSRTSREPLRTR